MASALASQLGAMRSLNAQRLITSAQARQSHAPTSYLFSSRDASRQDLRAVHAIALNGWEELCMLDESVALWASSSQGAKDAVERLLAEGAVTTDRTMLGKEDNASIDAAVQLLLRRLGAHLLHKSVSKIIEWLVRRFRIHEFNTTTFLAAFLPYHDTPQFTRVVQICDLSKAPLLASFLAPYKQQIKSAAQESVSGAPTLPLSSLLRSLTQSAQNTSALQLLRFVASLLLPPEAAGAAAHPPHRALVAFWTSVLVQFCVTVTGQPVGGGASTAGNKSGSAALALSKLKPADAQAYLGVLLPSALSAANCAPAQQGKAWREARLAGSMLLCATAGCFELSVEATAAIMHELVPVQATLLLAATSLPASNAAADAADAGAAGPSKRDRKKAQREDTLQLRAVLAACYALCVGAAPAPGDVGALRAVSQQLFDAPTLDALAALPGIDKAIEEDCQQNDTSAFLRLLLVALHDRAFGAEAGPKEQPQRQRAASLLSQLLTAKHIPSPVRDFAGAQLVALPLPGAAAPEGQTATATATTAEAHKSRVALLVTLRQRFPQTFDAALESFSRSASSSKRTRHAAAAVAADASAHKARLLQDVIAESTLSQLQAGFGSQMDLDGDATSGSGDSSQLWLALLSSQATEREVALRSLVDSFKLSSSTSDEQKRQMKLTLLSRMRDVSPKVLHVLYHTPSASKLLAALTTPDELLAVLESTFADRAALDAGVVALHLGFTFDQLLAGKPAPTAAARAFTKVVFPSLLSRGSASVDAATAPLVVLSKAKAPAGDDIWARCLRALQDAGRKVAKGKSPAAAAELNDLTTSALAGCLAEAPADVRAPAIAFLIKEAQRHSPLALLVLADFVGRVSPDDAGLDAASWLAIIALCQGAVADADSVPEEYSLSDARRLALDAAAEETDTEATRAITAVWLLPQVVQSLQGITASSLLHLGSTAVSSTVADASYRTIVSSRLDEPTVDALAVSWVVALGQSSLVRLASIFVDRSTPLNVRLIAGRHLAAALASDKRGQPTDMQTLLPALLIALNDAESHLRRAAVDCLVSLEQSHSRASGKSATAMTIFGVDSVYGPSSEQLQFLQPADSLTLQQKLVAEGTQLVQDPSHVRQLLSSILATSKGEPRKESAWKHAVLCCLLSHVVCWPSSTAKVTLLELLADVRAPAKLQTLLPSLRSLLDKYEQGVAQEIDERALVLHYQAYDRSARSLLTDGSEAWSTLLAGLRHGSVAVRKAAAKAVVTVYPSLSEPLRLQLVIALAAESCLRNETEVGALASCLLKLPIEAATMQGALAHFRPMLADLADAAPAAKKARRSESTSADVRTAGRAHALLLAVLSTIRISLTAPLASDLVEDVRIISGRRVASAFDAERSIVNALSTLDTAAADPKRRAEIMGNVRVDVLVGLLKMSLSRSTLHKVLTLLAKVADVAAEQVVHNIMPIFTFVGASVMSRDDDSSFAIVELSIRDIVPALSNVYRKQTRSSDHFALLLHCRDFLRIFTNAVRYMPRHRRAATFCLLVDTLGADTFLGAVCLLLVDRHSSKIVKSGGSQAAGLLDLPLSIIREYPAATRAAALGHCMAEVPRLISIGQAEPVTVADKVFLDRLAESGSEHAPHHQDGARQASAILAFVAAVVADGGLEEASARSMIDKASKITLTQDEVLRTAALAVVEKAVAELSSEGFVELVHIYVSQDSLFDDGVRTMLARQAAAGPADRKAFSAKLKDLIPCLWSGVSAGSGARRHLSVRALAILEQRISDDEAPHWADLLSRILRQLEKDPSDASLLLPLAIPIVSTIGPRVIPLVAKIVKTTSALMTAESTPDVASSGFALLTALVKATPSFAVAHLSTLIDLLLISGTSGASAATGLANAVIRSFDGEQVLAELDRQWSQSVQSGRATTFIAFLRRFVTKAEKTTVLRVHKAVFRLLLQIFDARAKYEDELGDDDILAVEDDAIAAFLALIMRLNETVFRPLFLRFYDWAAVDLVEEGDPWRSDAARSRTTTFFRFFCAMQEQLKSLVTSYTTTTLDYTLQGLKARAAGVYDDDELWAILQRSLANSARHDDGSFWNSTRAKRTIATLVDGLALAADGDTEDVAESTAEVVTAIARTVADPALLKTVNRSLLGKTRAASPKESTAAVIVLTQLWDAVGEEMLSLVAETAPFLSEVLGNGDADQVDQAQLLVQAIEQALGEPLDQYLS